MPLTLIKMGPVAAAPRRAHKLRAPGSPPARHPFLTLEEKLNGKTCVREGRGGMMLWFKALHVIFMVTWFGGLFYLPRLFVYHAMAMDPISIERFKIMERKLYFGIMTPGAILTIISGLFLYVQNPLYYWHAPWMWVKLIGVFLLIIFHILCGYYRWQFKQDQNFHSDKFYRVLNEIPIIFLFVIVIMVIVQPSF